MKSFDWTALDADPTSPAVRDALLAELRRRRQPSVVDKRRFIETFVRGKSVLDLGVVGHIAATVDSPDWLHGHICRCAKETLGVDILQPEVALLCQRGFDVVAADATSEVDLGRRFERVVMGDLLEHVTDQAKLLRFAARHLAPGGRILATTPNPFYYGWIYESVRTGTCIANAEHVTWVGPTMALEVARRAGVQLAEYRLLRPIAERGTWRTKIVDFFASRYFTEQEIFAQSYVYLFAAD